MAALFAFLAIVALSPAAEPNHGERVLDIDESATAYDVAPHGIVIPDAQQRWTSENVRSLIDAFQSGSLSPRTQEAAEPLQRYWFLFRVRNQTRDSDWVVSFHAPLIRRVTLFQSPGQLAARPKSSGYATPVQHRVHPALDYSLPISLRAGETQTVAVLIEEPGAEPPDTGDIRLKSDAEFRSQTFRIIAAAFLSLGAILGVGIYMVLIWLRLRERMYLWFGAFALSSFVLWGTHYEIFRLLLIAAYDFTLLNFLANSASLAFCLLFVRSFLRLDAWSTRWHSCATVLVCGLLALIGVVPFLSERLAYQLNALAALVVLIFVVAVGVHAVIQRVERAGIFLAAWAVYFSTGLLTIIDALGYNLPTVTVRLYTVTAVALGMLVMAWSVGNQLQELVSQKHLAEMKARTDALTQLGNRASFDDQLSQFQHQYDAGLISDILVLFADLDGLKRINDTHGHDVGDGLLRDFARLLEECFRNVDGIFRVGGDEFVVMLPDARPAFAEWMPGRIERIIEQLRQEGYAEASVSIGVAMASETDGGLEEAVRIADTRMYEQKASAR